MREYSRITPEGTKDILFKECRLQREVEGRLSRGFLHRGYNEVLTSGLEYFDVFCLPGAGIPQQEMYKTTDNNGRLIVFRPDSTLPIARMTAARLQNAERPIRLFYNQAVYRNRPDLSGRSNEIPQMGVELLGAAGLKADIEIITMAAEALSHFGEDFRIEIGHAGLFKAFADRLTVSAEVRERIRAVIETKNYAALGEQLSALERTEAVEAIEHLPRLFGDFAALEEAEKYCVDDETKAVLSYLKQLYTALSNLGYGSRILVDLGLVQRNDYYSGVVFSAYVKEYGDAVLAGGRYDNLLEKFGTAMPAIGFSIDTGSVSEILFAKDVLPQNDAARMIVHWEDGCEAQAQEFIKKRIANGEICETSLMENLEDCIKYAEKLGITRVIHMTAGDIKEYSI